MPFDPNRLWGYDLIRGKLLAGRSGEALFRAKRRLGLLPYALGLAWDSVESFSTIAHEIGGRKGVPLRPREEVLSEVDRDRLTYRVDSFMDSARRAQNALLRFLPGELPESITDIVKHFEKPDFPFPSLLGLKPTILSYWLSTGRAVRVYRVQSQHYPMVVSQAAISRDEAGNVFLALGLPSIDHDSKAQATLDFSQSVNALTFLQTAFGELVRFVGDILRWRLENLGLEQYARITFSIPTDYVDPSRLSAEIVPTPEEIRRRLAGC
jgi:hypothetical protein